MLSALIPLVSMLAGAGTGSATAERMELANNDVVEVMRAAFVEEASARGLPVLPDAVTYVTLGSSFLVHGAPVGADLHTEEEFAAGVDVTFLYVGGTRSDDSLPNGFYRVHATLPLGAEEGLVEFIDGSGDVAGTSRLLVRSSEAQEAFLPGSTGTGPVSIPHITSTHIFSNTKEYVDCYGWTPRKTFYFAVRTL